MVLFFGARFRDRISRVCVRFESDVDSRFCAILQFWLDFCATLLYKHLSRSVGRFIELEPAGSERLLRCVRYWQTILHASDFI